MYRENRIGPRIEPCGAPQDRGACEETKFFTATANVRLEREEANQFWELHDKPTQTRSRSS